MLLYIANSLLHGLTFVARGGGGGSGGGGGGGGGGGSGGGSGDAGIFILVVLFVVGYLPTAQWAKSTRKRLDTGTAAIATLIGTATYAGFWVLVGSVTSLKGWAFAIAFLSLVGCVGGWRGWGQVLIKQVRGSRKEITEAAQADPAWDLFALQQRARAVFMQFQTDWSTFNIDSMKTYLSERYWQHMSLVLAAIKQRERRNNVGSPTLSATPEPIVVKDFEDNTKDRVSFLISAQAHDVLLESIDGKERELFAENSAFAEYWNFIRSGDNWLLDGISQSTEDISMLRSDIEVFATKSGMFYSKDWGWLLLPSRGILFSGGRFGASDINNHVIGMYHDLIVELYTYLPNTDGKNSNSQQVLVAQVVLPKRYDSLIVEAKQGGLLSIFQRAPKGYNKLSLEWNDFNKRYNVYATNVEQVTAFELLHPVYMEKLFALPFKVSIEVVDNVVYLYSRDKKADYAVMYSLLKDAFEEMKL